MPQVIRGINLRTTSLPQDGSTATPTSPAPDRRVTFDQHRTNPPETPERQQSFPLPSRRSTSNRWGRQPSDRRVSDLNEEERQAYYDSRAATQREYRRRGSTLQSYYLEHPELLPQLPFTFRHGFKRWKLAGYIALMVFDACIVPIMLYYAMTFGGNVQGYITFAVITAIWGGPTYVEFALRSFRLIKKERFFKPLGANQRWAFDITNWILVLTIFVVTALLIVGAAPHIVFLRVLSMPGPAILYCITGPVFLMSAYSAVGWKAPFRISSTEKGGKVLPGIYYIVEDITAVNAGGGRPFREGWAARYNASPIFRKMIRDLSWFWSIPGLFMAVVLTVIVCINPVPEAVAYGIGWGVPFLWAGIWAAITVPWVQSALAREKTSWEDDTSAMDDVKPEGPPAVAPGPLGEKTSDDSTLRGSAVLGRPEGATNDVDAKKDNAEGESPPRPSEGTTL